MAQFSIDPQKARDFEIGFRGNSNSFGIKKMIQNGATSIFNAVSDVASKAWNGNISTSTGNTSFIDQDKAAKFQEGFFG